MKRLKMKNQLYMFIGNSFRNKFLSSIAILSLTTLILPLSACDKSLRISRNQGQVLKVGANNIRIRKDELELELNKLKPQSYSLPQIIELLSDSIKIEMEDIEVTKNGFNVETRNLNLRRASDRFFSDVTKSYLEYREPVEKMTEKTSEITINGYFKLLDKNSKALMLIAAAETFEYKIIVSSIPAKAKIFFRLQGGNFTQYGETDKTINGTIEGIEITRAEWQVKVEMNGKSQMQTCNYDDPICCLTFDLTK